MPIENEAAYDLILKVFGKEHLPGERPVPDASLATAAEFVANNEEAADQLASLVFPAGVPTDTAFYKGLYELERRLGFSPQTSILASELGRHALTRMKEDEREKVLNELVNVAGSQLFEALRPMPTIITRIRFRPEFLIPWFLRLHQRIKTDMAQGDFWRAVEMWSVRHPDDSLAGLQELLELSLDDDKVSIAACILGSLRVAQESKSPNAAARALQGALLGHVDVQRRLVFHRSWINTGWQRKLTTEEFAKCLERMSAGTAEEQVEAFNFLRCLLPSENITPESLHHGVRWLTAHSNPSLADNSKYWVATAAHVVARRKEVDSLDLKALSEALIAIQPVPTKHSGTWQALEGFLADLLGRDAGIFEDLLLGLLDANPDGIMHCFTAPGSFERLLSEIPTRTGLGFYGHLFFSPKSNRRRFAFVLYDELPFNAFPKGMLEKRSDDEIALALLQFGLNRLSPEYVVTFLALFLKRVEAGSVTLKQLYEDELLYQAKNLPGVCLERLKALSEKSGLVRSVATKAEEYFEALRKCHLSPLVAMEIPGLERAMRIQGARQSRQIDEMSREMSVFAKLFATSYLLYGGKTFRYCPDGALGEISELRAFSAQSELPRLEMIDPEGAAIRRHHNIDSIRQLVAEITGKEVVNGS